MDDNDSLRRGGPTRSLALLGFRDVVLVVMLRRGDKGSIDDLLRTSAVEEERAGKLDNGVADVLAAPCGELHDDDKIADVQCMPAEVEYAA